MKINSEIIQIEGGITTPIGFLAAGMHVGLKRKSKDLALIFSDDFLIAAGAFTTNQVKAAPVLWSKNIIAQSKSIRAIIINSGQANACTGEQGIENTKVMAQCVSELLDIEKEQVLVFSTGVIGVQIPMNKMREGILKIVPKLSNSRKAAKNAAEAIRTTDTFTKETCVQFHVDNTMISIGGMSKGSGMIHPNMATMLAYITTDVNINRDLLQKALSECVDGTFNMISVDGDTSTNDSVVLVSSCKQPNKPITDIDSDDYKLFVEALNMVCEKLAKSIVKDGEGATKFIEVKVENAKTKADAQKLAKSVISSNLVKTAMFGNDANWGRVLCALGYAGVAFNELEVDFNFRSSKGVLHVFGKGKPIEFDEKEALQILKEDEVIIEVNINNGVFSSTAWGCDLSFEYVKINGQYRT